MKLDNDMNFMIISPSMVGVMSLEDAFLYGDRDLDPIQHSSFSLKIKAFRLLYFYRVG